MPEKLEYAWEPLAALLDDGLAEIVATHWDEVAVHREEMPLSVDWEGYAEDEERGLLRLMSARRGEELVGYASYFVIKHRHYSTTIHALNDAIFVLPGVRGAGIGLIRAVEKSLAAQASPRWVRIVYHAKMHVAKERGTFARVFEALGYNAFETCHDKLVRA